MNKFNYIKTSPDGKTAGAVSSDYISHQLLNRSIDMVSLVEGDTGIGFTLSDGAHIKFRLKTNTAEVIYDPPSKR